MKNLALTAALALLAAGSGCAVANKTYGPDGRLAFSINCSGPYLSWGECFKKAGDICGSGGYETLAVNGQSAGTIVTANPTSGVFATPVIERIMMISCGKSPTPSQSQ